MYRSIRDYEKGDELKRINWKASARFGKLYTNQYEDSFNCPVFVFLNLSDSSYGLKLKWDVAEAAIEYAAAIVSKVGTLNQSCGFATTGITENFTETTSSPFLLPRGNQWNCILDLLSEIQLSNISLFESGLLQRAIKALPSGGKFYYIGPEFSSPEEQVTFEAELYKIAGHISLETIYCGERS